MPIHPDRVSPEIDKHTNRVIYHITTQNGNRVTLKQENILHLRGLSFDGLMGLSPIEVTRQAIGAAQAVEKYGMRYFKNNAKPSGIIYYDKQLQDPSKEQIKKAWQENFTGTKQHSVSVLDLGLKFQPISINNEDSQFLQTRRFSVENIARIFRIPRHMIADLEKSSCSNITQQSLEFIQYTMLPWVTRWESALETALLNDREQETHFIEFNMTALLRGDQEARFKSYATGRQWGWLSPNDVRRLENMYPIPDGNFYSEPLNMIPIGTERNPDLNSTAGTGTQADSQSKREANRLTAAFTSQLRSTLERAATRERGALDKLEKRCVANPAARESEKQKFNTEQRDFIRTITKPVFESFAAGTALTAADIQTFTEVFAGSIGSLREADANALEDIAAAAVNKLEEMATAKVVLNLN